MRGALGLIYGTAFRVPGHFLRTTQGSAAAAQPWAGLSDPVGVEKGRGVRESASLVSERRAGA